MRRRNFVILLLATFTLGAMAVPADAARGLFTKLQDAEPVSPSDLAPPTPSPAEPIVESYAPGCAAPACCAPCIDYRYKRRCKKTCCGCEPPISAVLNVPVPKSCGGCIDVPVCIPGCCVDVPTVKCKKKLFKDGVVVYEWCCGYKLTVAFKKSGDLLVTYYGK